MTVQSARHREKSRQGDVFGTTGILDCSTVRAMAKYSFAEKTSDGWGSGSGNTGKIQKLQIQCASEGISGKLYIRQRYSSEVRAGSRRGCRPQPWLFVPSFFGDVQGTQPLLSGKDLRN